MNLNKEPFPTVGDINAKLPELDYIRNYTYTDVTTRSKMCLC